MKIIVQFLMACLLLAPVAIVHAQDNGTSSEESDGSWRGRMRERMEKKVQEIYGQLNLSEEQKKLLDENKTNNWDKMQGSFAARKQLREQLSQELMNKELDMVKINAIQTQLKELQNQTVDSRLNSILEVRKILTPEQFSKFITLMEEQKRQNKGMMDKD